MCYYTLFLLECYLVCPLSAMSTSNMAEQAEAMRGTVASMLRGIERQVRYKQHVESDVLWK